MIGSVFHRRRAERFAQLLDEATGARRHHTRSTLDDSLTGLTTVGRRLRELPVAVEARQEFRDDLRTMLLATIEREGIGPAAKEPEPEPVHRVNLRSLRRPAGSRPAVSRRTRGAIVIGLAAGTLAVSGMSAASNSAIPGDALYSIKRSTERAQLALAGSDTSKGELYLSFARTRLGEAQEVRDPAGLSSVLDDMDSETIEGVRLLMTTAMTRKDTTALDTIDGFVTKQRGTAEKLKTSKAGDARTRAAKSLALLDDIDRRSRALRPLVRCGSAAVDVADVYGPVPAGTACRPGNKSGGDSGASRQPSVPAASSPSQSADPAATGSVSPSPSVSSSASAAAPTPSASAPAGQNGDEPTPTHGRQRKGLIYWLLN